MRGKYWIAAGALLASLGVTAGAVGTHVLKETMKLPETQLETYEVAVRYQLCHALGLIVVGLLLTRVRSKLIFVAGLLFLAGSVLFSGGIYAWIFTEIKPFIHVVPIGGMAWIVGWLLLAVGILVAWPREELDEPGR